MQRTKIEYLTHTWNPISMICTPVSSGCENCWHLAVAKRFGHGSNKPVLKEDELMAPTRRKKPAVIGVQFMGDLFHPDVSMDMIHQVICRCSVAKQHTFILLTKRPERLIEYCYEYGLLDAHYRGICPAGVDFPPNIVVGVSVEDQETANERIPILLQFPSARRIVSIEPMLGPVDLTEIGGVKHTTPDGVCRPLLRHNSLRGFEHCGSACYEYQPNRLDGVILGGESGPGARPMHPDWARFVRDQCKDAGVPFYFKQWGEYGPYKYANGVIDILKLGKKKSGRLLDGVIHDQLCWNPNHMGAGEW